MGYPYKTHPYCGRLRNPFRTIYSTWNDDSPVTTSTTWTQRNGFRNHQTMLLGDPPPPSPKQRKKAGFRLVSLYHEKRAHGWGGVAPRRSRSSRTPGSPSCPSSHWSARCAGAGPPMAGPALRRREEPRVWALLMANG